MICNVFYFDDQDWGIRYLVVDTGRRRSGRKVVISASAIGSPDRTTQELPVSLTKTQVKHSPDIDTRRPVSRHESEYFGAYGYPYYWSGLGVDDSTWAIRYLLVKTSNGWGGRRVLVAPECIEDVNWSKTTVSVDLTRQAIKDAPSYDAAQQHGHERNSTCISG